MIYHVLNGDALAAGFALDGEIVVCRECLIDGDVRAGDSNDFWQARADFVKREFGADDYFAYVKAEFDKLDRLTPDDEVNLWFGNDAFCLVNLSFILRAFGDKGAAFYRVFPNGGGWDCRYSDLSGSFASRRKLTRADLTLGAQIWTAFCKDRTRLRDFEKNDRPAFPGLPEVCRAISEIESRPSELLREITATGETDFAAVFRRFQEKAGLYGFGDAQVKRVLARL